LLFHDGNEDVNRNSDPDLAFDCIFRRAIKRFYVKMLFDPFEKKFDLSALFVKLRNRQSWQRKVVGKKNKCVLIFNIEEFNASEFVWVIFF
jgi:hypothetical protein